MPQIYRKDIVSVSVSGSKQTMLAFEYLKRGIRNRITRRAVATAVVPQNKAAKRTDRFKNRTGQLRRSLGTRVKTYRQSGAAFGVVGSRKGFRKTLVRTGGRIGAFDPGLGYRPIRWTRTSITVDPRRYIHLVELGTKRARAREFLRNAFHQSKSEALTRFNSKFIAETSKETLAAAAAAGANRV